ncbi:hypothetical protein LOC68_16440 [Blastopirellula sp. JC732]|uniref:Uncharacterized protein n=1 Tax=Blastopirellula sediminis TaxID=2894196 RepID=A0A9X1SHB7_9BACT|nr:hypothetical protein [Blastopirellula sediminis]MCC9606721.1 hypothetical protein [Blastopirellula sediminis]MCC9629982.1 hypothetical protein [Blastopirellula sediminis]
MNDPGFDKSLAHRHFAAHCFNSTWDLIDKTERTKEEEVQMLLRAAASVWHWTEREDCTPKNLSIGYWQLSRVFALIGEGSLATRFGQMCLEASPADDPFLVGYAYECLARAATVLGDKGEMQHCLAEANLRASHVGDDDNRAALLADLATIRS